MSEIVLEDIAYLVEEIGDPPRRGANLRIVDREIDAIQPEPNPHWDPDVRVDGSSLLVMPGLINTHHHFFQTLNRAIPAVQTSKLFEWLKYLYDLWNQLTPEMVRVSSQIAAAELIRSGCTTSVDHMYVYPEQYQDRVLETEIEAVRKVGLRFHPARGSMSLSREEGGLPPEALVQDPGTILRHTQDIIDAYHDPRPYSMTRVLVAPCAPFTVSDDLMRESRTFAQEHDKIRFHTHLAETLDEERHCMESTGRRPFEYVEELGWVQPDSFFAHAIHLNREEIRRLSRSGAGVAHCPTSNMRLGSGMAPVVDMLEAGVPVGLGVDGSASNDSSHMFAELRQALLLQRVNYSQEALSARDVLRAATVGGAKLLGREDVGVLQPGMAADLIGIRLDRLEFAGGQHDPLAATVFCHPPTVDYSIINGEIVLRKGEFTQLDLETLIRDQNRLAEEQFQNL